MWSADQARAAWLLVRSHAGKLLAHGLDAERIPEPLLREVGVLGKDFTIRFRYDEGLIMALKRWPAPPHPRLDPTQKGVWRVGTSPIEVECLRSFADIHRFTWTTDALERAATVLQAAERRLALSEAPDADVNVPGLGGTLRPFQRACVAWGKEVKRGLIGDEMGCGKTIEALAIAQVVGGFPLIVVCPSQGGLVKNAWVEQARFWLPGRTVQVLEGERALVAQADVTVVNYDILRANLGKLRELGARMVVFDEAHYLKTPSSSRTQAAAVLVEGVEYLFLLTGTPVLNRPLELESMLRILGVFHQFGTPFQFRMGLCNNPVVLNRRLKETCYIRRRKEDVLPDLPPKQRSVLWVELENRTAYDRALRRTVDFLLDQDDESLGRKHMEGLALIEGLRQLAGEGKLDAIEAEMRSVGETGEQLVVFAHHIRLQEAIARRFPGCATIRGGAPTENKQSVARFVGGDSQFIVCSLQAGGFGIDGLQKAACNVLFTQPGWTPAIHDQAEDRLHRSGQTRMVNAIYLLAQQTIEQDIWNLLTRKREVVNAVTDGITPQAQHERAIQREIMALLRAAA